MGAIMWVLCALSIEPQRADGSYGWAFVFILAALNQSQGGMCICRTLGIGLGGSQEGLGP